MRIRQPTWVMIVSSAAGMLAGCRTPNATSTHAGRPDALPGLAAKATVESPAPEFCSTASGPYRALHEAAEAYRGDLAKASNDAGRLAAVETLIVAVDAWRLRYPDAATTEKAAASAILESAERCRARLEFSIARAQARADARSAQTVAGALQALSRELALVKSAAQSVAFSDVERQALRDDAATLQAAMARFDLDGLIECAHRALEVPVTYRDTMRACRRALDRLRAEATRPYWQDVERAWIAAQIDETEAAMRRAEAEYREVVGQVRDELRRAQTQMVNTTAKGDYRHANQIYQAEKAKWLNWRILSRPRDNTTSLVTSVRLCDRITAEERVDHPLRGAAAELHHSVLARFDRDERQQYETALPLPPYTALAQYPRLSSQGMEAEAEQRWLFRRQNRPACPGEEAVPQEGTL